jgi:hypothetical protein
MYVELANLVRNPLVVMTTFAIFLLGSFNRISSGDGDLFYESILGARFCVYLRLCVELLRAELLFVVVVCSRSNPLVTFLLNLTFCDLLIGVSSSSLYS